jgi:hypothetical protein
MLSLPLRNPPHLPVTHLLRPRCSLMPRLNPLHLMLSQVAPKKPKTPSKKADAHVAPEVSDPSVSHVDARANVQPFSAFFSLFANSSSLPRHLSASMSRPIQTTWPLFTGLASPPASTFCKAPLHMHSRCNWFFVQPFVFSLVSIEFMTLPQRCPQSCVVPGACTGCSKLLQCSQMVPSHAVGWWLVFADSCRRIILAVGCLNAIRFLALPNLEKVMRCNQPTVNSILVL